MTENKERSIQRIRMWRKRRKLTLEKLASTLGTSAGHLHKWETGKVSVNVDRLNQIAKVLGIGLHDLIFDPVRFDSTPVIGILDHFGRVEIVEDFASGETRLYVDAPDGVEVDSGAAIEVSGDALQPIPNGWLIFFNRTYSGVSDEAAGSLCVVKIADQPDLIVRRVSEGTKPPFYNLFSPHSTEMIDIKLDWACPVVCLRPMPRADDNI